MNTDHDTPETFCIVATQGKRRFIYANFQTFGGASIAAAGLRENGTCNRRGYRRPVTDVRIVLLHTPKFRAADYNMTAHERDVALAAPATTMTTDLVTGKPVYHNAQVV